MEFVFQDSRRLALASLKALHGPSPPPCRASPAAAGHSHVSQICPRLPEGSLLLARRGHNQPIKLLLLYSIRMTESPANQKHFKFARVVVETTQLVALALLLTKPSYPSSSNIRIYDRKIPCVKKHPGTSIAKQKHFFASRKIENESERCDADRKNTEKKRKRWN